MTRSRIIALATATAAFASAGIATAAEAPVVSAQKTYTGTKAPETVPGTGLKKGAKLPKGARLIYRTVTLEGDQKTTLTLRAPKGKTLRGLVPSDDAQVGFAVVKPRSYVGKRQVQVRAFASDAEETTGRIYALVR